MTNKTQRHLSRELTASQPSPNGKSAVTILRLSRGASIISTVTTRYLNRERTVEMPFKAGFFRLDYSGAIGFRLVFAGLTHSMEQQTSCAPTERELVSLSICVVKDRKTKRGFLA